MNLGLIQRALREIAPVTLLCAALLSAISGLLAYALPQVQARFAQRSFIPPGLQQLRNVMLGVDSSTGGIADIAFSIGWSHPVVLILLCTQAIFVCTRVPAGEIERGTIDILMGLPVSRWQLFLSETVAWLISGVFVLIAIYLGSYIGAMFINPEYRPSWGKLAMVLVNLGFVYALVSTLGLLAGTISDRRGRAVLFVLVIAVGSLLLNYLQLIWDPAKHVSFLSFLHYYRPIGMLQRGEWPWRDLAILGSGALCAWTAAGVMLSKRPLTTL